MGQAGSRASPMMAAEKAPPPSRGTGGFEHPSHAKGAVKRARRLRADMNVGERKLWEELRKLDLHIRRQAPIGRYIADFAHHSAKLVIEVDGGRHDLPENQLHDHDRDEWLRSQGYRIMRVRDQDVIENPKGVAERVSELLKALPLDGEGLGWGAFRLDQNVSHEAVSKLPHAVPPQPTAHTPQSPTLSPSRGKGEAEPLAVPLHDGRGE
jgi:very-short-patch-repair endonuclease